MFYWQSMFFTVLPPLAQVCNLCFFLFCNGSQIRASGGNTVTTFAHVLPDFSNLFAEYLSTLLHFQPTIHLFPPQLYELFLTPQRF